MPLSIVFKQNEVTLAFASDDRIFLGEGLFETLQVADGKPCFADLHWERLQQASKILGIAFELSLDEWRENLDKCVTSAELINGGIKALLSAGRAPRGLGERGLNPCLLLEAFSYQKTTSAIKLVSAPWRRDASNPVYQLKSINYLESIFAYRYAQTVGANDALFFNSAECAMETTIANLFLIKDDELFTPSLDSGVLAGITRRRILDYCRDAGIPCHEIAIHKHLIADADALFTCNALQGIRPIAAFDEFSFEKPNSLLNKLKVHIG